MTITHMHTFLLQHGNLYVPGSRYGLDTEDCSWWAIACQQIAVAEGCDDYESTLDYYMGLAVNNSDSMAEFVYENRYNVTRTVLRHLGGLRTIKELI